MLTLDVPGDGEGVGDGVGVGVGVGVGDGLDGGDVGDAEDILVHAKHGGQVPELIGDLRGERRLQLVIGGSQEEGSEHRRDLELGVEAVREDPDEPLSRLLVERCKRRCVRRVVDLERRPLVPFPVLVERTKRPCALFEILILALCSELGEIALRLHLPMTLPVRTSSDLTDVHWKNYALAARL